MDVITLAGEQSDSAISISVVKAAQWLLGDEGGHRGYNRLSVAWFDFAGENDRDAARSPR